MFNKQSLNYGGDQGDQTLPGYYKIEGNILLNIGLFLNQQNIKKLRLINEYCSKNEYTTVGH